jgi:hypothetical protein
MALSTFQHRFINDAEPQKPLDGDMVSTTTQIQRLMLELQHKSAVYADMTAGDGTALGYTDGSDGTAQEVQRMGQWREAINRIATAIEAEQPILEDFSRPGIV